MYHHIKNQPWVQAQCLNNYGSLLLLYYLPRWIWNLLQFNPSELVCFVTIPVFRGCDQSDDEAVDVGLTPKWASWHGPDLWPGPYFCAEQTILQMSALILQGSGGERWVSENPLWLLTNKSVHVSLMEQSQNFLYEK